MVVADTVPNYNSAMDLRLEATGLVPSAAAAGQSAQNTTTIATIVRAVNHCSRKRTPDVTFQQHLHGLCIRFIACIRFVVTHIIWTNGLVVQCDPGRCKPDSAGHIQSQHSASRSTIASTNLLLRLSRSKFTFAQRHRCSNSRPLQLKAGQSCRKFAP
jgi:hypothetical protein